jgi:hypothetical protein
MTKRIDAMACLSSAEMRLGWAQRRMSDPGAWTDDPLIFSGDYEAALAHVVEIRRMAGLMEAELNQREAGRRGLRERPS